MKIIIMVYFLLILICSIGMAQVDSSGYINVGNDQIFYETAGKGSILIFIHDGLVHREIWDGQFFFFSQNHKVIRYDRRGYGKSSAATGPYSNIEDLNSLFTHLKIDKACLISMSSGGRLAIDFALEYPIGEFDIPDVHAHAGAINAGIANSKRDIILKSGHLIPIEQPEIFNKRVQKFLNGLSDWPTANKN